MLSRTQLVSMYTKLSQNTSSDNETLGLQLMNQEQRYLLQKYFSNEGTFTTTTVGSQDLTSTGSFSAAATSGTLTSAWPYHTTTAYVTFSNGDIRRVNFTKNSTAITWSGGLSATATTALDVGGVQYYPAPPNFSKLKTLTIMQGALLWTPDEIRTRQEWDQMNVFPYYGDIPNNFYVYPGGDHGAQFGIWPIPSTTGNLITFNYKYRIPDLSLADDTTGTVSVSNSAVAVTGSGTAFIPTTNAQLESRWLQISPNKGDNLWYQIASVDSTTAATLYQPYQGITVSGGSFTIGQMPIIMEDFHDMLVYKALTFYFSSIVDNPKKRAEFEDAYNKKLEMLDEYAGSNTVNVNLGRRPLMRNPNLYGQSFGG